MAANPARERTEAVGSGVNRRPLFDYGCRMRILVTGFEPFGGDQENASEQVVKRLRERAPCPGVELATAILPCTWAGAGPALLDAIAAHRPEVILSLGEAGSRTAVTPEHRAHNRGAGRIPDNAGVVRPASPLDAGPEWLETRIDPAPLAEAIRAVGVPAQVSETAGAFLCNAAFRTLLRDTEVPGTFIHLPAVRNRGRAGVGAETDAGAAVKDSGLTIDQLVDGVEASIRCVAEQRRESALDDC